VKGRIKKTDLEVLDSGINLVRYFEVSKFCSAEEGFFAFFRVNYQDLFLKDIFHLNFQFRQSAKPGI
jgi:hypothetical protein